MTDMSPRNSSTPSKKGGSSRRGALIILAVLIVEVAGSVLLYLKKSAEIAGGFGFPMDDSWIHSQLARNWAQGMGMAYSPGHPVSSTAILYTLLLGLAFKIRLSPVTDAMVIGVTLHIAASYLIYLATGRLGLARAYCVAAAVLFAGTPRLIWGALGGTETPLYVFLLCLGIYWHLRYVHTSGWAGYLPTLAFGLAALARPECAVIVVLALIDKGVCAAAWRRETRDALSYLRSLPIHLALTALLLLPWAVFNWSCSGHPLPPAFYVKVTNTMDGAALGLAARLGIVYEYIRQAIVVTTMDNWLVALGMVPGLIAVIGRSRRENGALLLPLVFLGLPTVVGQVARTQSVGAQLIGQCGRYSGYLVPTALLMGIVGWACVAELLSRRFRALPVRLAPLLVVAAALVVCLNNNVDLAELYGWQVQNINGMQVEIGKWAAALPAGTLIATNDAGAIAYFSHQPVIDTEGIVTPEVHSYWLRHSDFQIGLWEYLSKAKPQYLAIFPNWYPEIARKAELTYVTSVELDNNVACGGPQMVVFATPWTRQIRQR